MSETKRNKKLIQISLQLKLVMVFVSLSCLAALFQVVALNRSVMRLATRMPTDGERMLAELPDVLSANLLITVLVLVPLTITVGVLVTHRVAGPVFRFEEHLKAIARGEDPGRCELREGDELQELCQCINAAVERLRNQGSSNPEQFHDAA
jgi:nitrogen fixation/metabolism regulation signal transduction histidine kinase